MNTKVYFVRHAKPDFSIKNEARPLSSEGIKDSKKVTYALTDKNISSIYSSPYIRAVDTLKDFAEKIGLEIVLVEDFRERSVGDWVDDFLSFSKMQWKDFDYKLPTGESLREVQSRNIKALIDILNKNQGENIVIGTHGTALSTIINYYDRSFGYDDFMKIIDKMPYIICFEFYKQDLLDITEIEI